MKNERREKVNGGGNSLKPNKLYKINLTISFEECKELVELLECLEEEDKQVSGL